MITSFKKIKKSDWQNWFFSVLLGISILVIVGYLIVSNWQINQKRLDYNEQIQALEQQLRELEIKKYQLEAQIYQTSEQEYLEEEARETFNLKKPGEEVVTVLPPEEAGEVTQEKERVWWNPFTW